MEHNSQPGRAPVKSISASHKQVSSSAANQGFPLCLSRGVYFASATFIVVAELFFRILRLKLERW
jgi:hypothetical protein